VLAPDLAMAAGAQAFYQGPVRSSRRVVIRLEGKAGRFNRRYCFNSHRFNEAIAKAVHRSDDRLVAVAQYLAQPSDAFSQYRLAEYASRPDASEQFVLRTHLTGVLQEIDKDLERFAFELDVDAVQHQFVGGFVQHGSAKVPAAPAPIAARRGRHHGHIRVAPALRSI
jgi:hypothetical protein